MSCSGPFRAVVFGVGLLLVGCADDAGVDAVDGADVAPPTGAMNLIADPTGAMNLIADPTGTTSTNGLPPSEYHPSAGSLFASTSLPLFEQDSALRGRAKASAKKLGDTTLVNPAVSALFTTPAARHTFRYALQCALPADQGAIFVNEKGEKEKTFGIGLLATAGGWTSDGLDDLAKNDLFACMAAHLNQVGATVPIRLTGAAVGNEEGEPNPKFSFREAYWQATAVTVGGAPTTYRVWPLPDLDAYCEGTITSEALALRVCGDVGGCGVSVRKTLGECAEDKNGNATCLGQRVIKSWLVADDAALLYPRCALLH